MKINKEDIKLVCLWLGPLMIITTPLVGVVLVWLTTEAIAGTISAIWTYLGFLLLAFSGTDAMCAAMGVIVSGISSGLNDREKF